MPIPLPAPRLQGQVSLEQALAERRSVREYADTPLSMGEVAQLLWAAQGQTASWGGRTAPSAGALYPLEVYLVVGRVDGLAPGVYRYRPSSHDLVLVRSGDVRRELGQAAVEQTWLAGAPAVLVITAVFARTTEKYGERGITYVHMESGHAAQNVCLQAVALGLGSVTVGAFLDDRVKELVDLRRNESPLYLIPVGRPK